MLIGITRNIEDDYFNNSNKVKTTYEKDTNAHTQHKVYKRR